MSTAHEALKAICDPSMERFTVVFAKTEPETVQKLFHVVGSHCAAIYRVATALFYEAAQLHHGCHPHCPFA